MGKKKSKAILVVSKKYLKLFYNNIKPIKKANTYRPRGLYNYMENKVLKS